MLAARFRQAMPNVQMVDAAALFGPLRGADGLHLTASEHFVLGAAIAEAVRNLRRPVTEGMPLSLASDADRDAYLKHLTRLSPESRRMRFCAPLEDAALVGIAAPKAGRKLLLYRDNGVVRGAVELHAMDGDAAEIALSLEDELHGRGRGKAMFRAGMSWARELGFSRLLVVCDAANKKMRRLVAATGATMTVEDGEAVAWIDLPAADTAEADAAARRRRHDRGAGEGRRTPQDRTHCLASRPWRGFPEGEDRMEGGHPRRGGGSAARGCRTWPENGVRNRWN